MVLVLNFFLKDEFAQSFDHVIKNHLRDSGKKCRFIRIYPDTKAEEILPSTQESSHLILSGSEASTLDEMGWEDEMKKIVLYFIEHHKPILGICYGHQFLIRCLAGKNNLRKSPKPEMGWGRISLKSNPLFKGIENPVCLLAHYDEAYDLPSDFTILGSSHKCAIHGFQYKDLPVWGVQFHPEYDLESGREILDDLEKNDARYHEHFENALENEHQLEQNRKFFTNFVSM